MTINQIIEPPPEPQFTEREVQIYLRGLSDARKIASQTEKGIIASSAIARHITTTSLFYSRSKENGVFVQPH